MALLFRREDADHDRLTDDTLAGSAHLRLPVLFFLLVLVALLLAGTLKITLLTQTYAQVALSGAGLEQFQDALDHLVPFDSSKGEEGISVQESS
jgi:hypothetical protein